MGQKNACNGSTTHPPSGSLEQYSCAIYGAHRCGRTYDNNPNRSQAGAAWSQDFGDPEYESLDDCLAAPQCPGAEPIDGTDGDDVISGTALPDLIQGFAGNDDIDGGKGDDCIDGGDGDDMLVGGAGADLIGGFAGADSIDGKAGTDAIDGGDGSDRITGGAGRDGLLGGAGNDLLTDGLGANVFGGGAGNDAISARQSVGDVIDCGPGDDFALVDKKDRVEGCESVARGGIDRLKKFRSLSDATPGGRAGARVAGNVRRAWVTSSFEDAGEVYRTQAESLLRDHNDEFERLLKFCVGGLSAPAAAKQVAIRKYFAGSKFYSPPSIVASVGLFIGGRIGSAISGATGGCGTAKQHLIAAYSWHQILRYRKRQEPWSWAAYWVYYDRRGLPDICEWIEWTYVRKPPKKPQFRVKYPARGSCP